MKLVVALLVTGCASTPPPKPPAYVDTPESKIDTESELTHAETAPPADAPQNFQRTGEIQETKLGSQHAAEVAARLVAGTVHVNVAAPGAVL